MAAQQTYTLFLDLDGVLVDFDAGVEKICGKSPQELEARAMWPRLAKSVDFYTNLGWMSDGRLLWEFTRSHNPIILTGLPMGNWAESQKRTWCRQELGAGVEVITCMSRQKAAKGRERSGETTAVLVDDRLKLKDAWKEMGGVFIHHQNSEQSITELKQLGF